MFFRILILMALIGSDPGGWAKAKWGMTEAQLMEIGTHLRQPDKINGVLATTGMESVKIGPVDFRAYFVLDAKGLREVYLVPVAPSDANEVVFQAVESLLVDKYGKPWTRDRTSQWTFPTTKITLRYTELKNIGMQVLNLDYVRRDDGAVSDNY